MIPEDHDDGRTAWDLVRVRQLLGDAGVVIAEVVERLDPLAPEALGAGAGVALSACEIDDAVNAVLTAHDLIDSAAVLTGGLRPREDALVLSRDEIAGPAAKALAAGSADRALVVLAAQLLAVEPGFHALAAALDDDPGLPAHWEGLTVAELLSAFRETGAATARQVCDAAGVEPGAEWTELDLAAIGRIAAALRERAGG